jgi:hypothetical protein
LCQYIPLWYRRGGGLTALVFSFPALWRILGQVIPRQKLLDQPCDYCFHGSPPPRLKDKEHRRHAANPQDRPHQFPAHSPPVVSVTPKEIFFNFSEHGSLL